MKSNIIKLISVKVKSYITVYSTPKTHFIRQLSKYSNNLNLTQKII